MSSIALCFHDFHLMEVISTFTCDDLLEVLHEAITWPYKSGELELFSG